MNNLVKFYGNRIDDQALESIRGGSGRGQIAPKCAIGGRKLPEGPIPLFPIFPKQVTGGSVEVKNSSPQALMEMPPTSI